MSYLPILSFFIRRHMSDSSSHRNSLIYKIGGQMRRKFIAATLTYSQSLQRMSSGTYHVMSLLGGGGDYWNTRNMKMLYCAQKYLSETMDHNPLVGHVSYKISVWFLKRFWKICHPMWVFLLPAPGTPPRQTAVLIDVLHPQRTSSLSRKTATISFTIYNQHLSQFLEYWRWEIILLVSSA